MKDKVSYIITLVFVITGLFVFIIYVAIPKAATLTLPFKWSHIPVGEKQ